MSETLTFSNPVFCNFAYYGTLLVGKTVLMTPLISFFRVKRDVYSNPEDLPLHKNPAIKINFNDETVERLRRIHQNDLENIVPFALIGLIYVTSEPDPDMAKRLFQIFTLARFVHTAVYLAGVRQPARFISSVVAVAVNLLMVWRTQFVLRFYF